MKVVVLDGGTLNPGDLSWDWLKQFFDDIAIYENTAPNNVIETIGAANIVIVNKVVLDQYILSNLPQLKYIAVTATGYNNVDILACNEANIKVSNVINYGSDTVAQHTFALLLSLTNRVERHNQLIQQGEWEKRGNFSFWEKPLIELHKKTIGIIGWGNIGRKVAAIAKGFGMKVLFYSASQNQSDDLAESVTLNKLLANSDVVSLHTHLYNDNTEMVNSEFLNKMKKTAFLVNTARGGLINEQDLAIALNSNIIAGAGLDVLSEEPAPLKHPLIGVKNCIITPHNAWASLEARQRMMKIVEENIDSYLKGKPKNLVN